MAIKAESTFASVVHDATAANARAESLFASVVHDVTAADARVESMFASVVHDVVLPRALFLGQELIRVDDWQGFGLAVEPKA